MSDDLKKALREWWEYDTGRLMENSFSRIEELEAKLEKAVVTLAWCARHEESEHARATLAELKEL